MNTSTKLFGGVIVAFVGLIASILIAAVYALSIYNDQASLQNHYDMKLKDNQSEFDNMWKKISQACQIADNKKESFKEIYAAWATSSTPQDGGKMMLWLKQVSPDVKGLDVYDNVMNIMTGSRDSFTMRQKELVSIAEIANGNLVTMPRGFFLKLFGFKHINPLVITSTRTQKVFDSGLDDDVSLTPAKK
jgi:hypothetical protein